MWKDWIRPLVRPLPQWSPISIRPPSQAVTATLRWHGGSADVTDDHTVASLKPLMIATSLEAGHRPVLEYTDSATGERLGVLRLVRTGSIVAETASLTLYHVAAGEHRCLEWPQRAWNAWLQNRSMVKHGAANHFSMEPAAAQQLMIAYLCPRPVVLVSVDTSDHHNIFPMDLIGPLRRSGMYSLALRSSNISEPVMRRVRRAALSSMPADLKTVVYTLSKHHRQPLTDWDALPLSMRPSRAFGIPVVAAALGIQELSVVHSEEIGSHTFFLCRVADEQTFAESGQLHHTAGFYQAYRRQHAMAFTEV